MYDSLNEVSHCFIPFIERNNEEKACRLSKPFSFTSMSPEVRIAIKSCDNCSKIPECSAKEGERSEEKENGGCPLSKSTSRNLKLLSKVTPNPSDPSSFQFEQIRGIRHHAITLKVRKRQDLCLQIVVLKSEESAHFSKTE